MAPPQPSLADRYAVHDRPVLLTGVQALVRLVLEQQRLDRQHGRRTAGFISGYEGSPLGGLDLELGRQQPLLEEYEIVHRPGVNEELAATSVFGTQLVPGRPDARHEGVVGYWYGKAPGLDRASDAIRHANFGGTHPAGGAVAFVGDDPSCKSSTVPSACEIALSELAIPTFCPGDAHDVIEVGLHAVALSRASGLWAGLKIVTDVADGGRDVVVPRGRRRPVVPEPGGGGRPGRHVPTATLVGAASVEAERTAYGIRMEWASAYVRLNGLNRLETHGSQDRIGFVAAGKTYLDLLRAFDTLGLDDVARRRYGIRLLRLDVVFPLEPAIVEQFASGLREIVVVEEKRRFVEVAIRDRLYGRVDAPMVLGKRDANGSPLVPADGELTAARLLEPLARRLEAVGDVAPVQAWVARQNGAALPATASKVPGRTPYFCSGCPHSRSTRVPTGSVVGAGIGCHTMVLMMDPDRVGDVVGLTQMGGEGAQWIGMSPFVGTPHLFQNVGDGTFHHSGSLALRAAVAAGVDMTYKLLYNSAVAMTGGQEAVGLRTVAEITRMLEAEGVKRTIITVAEPRRYRTKGIAANAQVWSQERLEEAQRVLAATPGVTVVIHDQQCATEKRRDRKRHPPAKPDKRVLINERVCEGCGDCGTTSNCLSVTPVDTDYGRKTQIHQGSCNTDLACLDGDCPSFLTVVPATSNGRKSNAGARATPAAASPPEPTTAVRRDEVAIRIAGIGGTGVVTVAQILAQAAGLSGWHVRTLDQTGLSQKAGPVISDIRLGRNPIVGGGRLGRGECDLYLGCDLLVAADDKNLVVADPGRTVGLLSLRPTPTGRMVTDPSAAFPDTADLVAGVNAVTRRDVGGALDAQQIAETSCGSDQYANLVMLGAAYQSGALPIQLSSLREAIRLNGVAVEQNLRAFELGRQAFTAPTTPVPANPHDELERILRDRSADLVAYQNAAYAKSYTEIVERVRTAEAMVAPGTSSLAEAVARNLYKLMAYKDEYEVARLSLEPELGARIAEQFGPGARVQWRFHPPVLRTLGMRRKLALGRWATPLLVGLRAGRRLRGTPLDPFGLTEVRRTERRLAREYREVVAELLAHLSADNHSAAVEIASLPDMVRGYEHIKLANVARYATRLRESRAAFLATSEPAR
jgi:indolepyruvate ferredoxin oxidoreductase